MSVAHVLVPLTVIKFFSLFFCLSEFFNTYMCKNLTKLSFQTPFKIINLMTLAYSGLGLENVNYIFSSIPII